MDLYDIGVVETKIENPALSVSGAEPSFFFLFCYSCQFCSGHFSISLRHHFVSKSCHNLHHHPCCRLKYAMQKISSIIRYKNYSLLNESWSVVEIYRKLATAYRPTRRMRYKKRWKMLTTYFFSFLE